MGILGGMFGGSGDYYNSLNRQRNQYVTNRIGYEPNILAPQYESGVPPEVMAARDKYLQDSARLGSEWLSGQSPETQALYDKSMYSHNATLDRINKTGAKVSQAIIAAIAGGAALQGLGALGAAGSGSGGSAAGGLGGWDAAMADLAASGGLTAGDMAAGAGAGGLSGWDAAMADLANSGGITGANMAPSAGGGGIMDLLKTGAGSVKDAATWAAENRGLVSGIGGLLSTIGAASGKGQTPGGAVTPTGAPMAPIAFGSKTMRPSGPLYAGGGVLSGTGAARRYTPNEYKPAFWTWG